MNSLKIDRESLSKSDELSRLLPEIHKELMDLSRLYPDFQKWYEQKVIPGVYSGERTLLLEMRSGVIAGLAIVKDDGFEKKLCCLRVASDFQYKSGIGYKLFERSMNELQTRYPLLSVGEDRLDEFNRIFSHFGFKKSWEYPDLYRPRKTEVSFNGILLPKKRVNVRYSLSATEFLTTDSFKSLPTY